MDRILRFAAAAAFGLAFAAPPALADSHGGVAVGGWIEVIGGSTDNDGSVDGISRGIFSRIAVSYDDTLDNGLTVAGRAAYQLNQRGTGVNVTQTGLNSSPRMDAATNFAPDVLFISVGGGFGTVNIGAHGGASCAELPRPIAFVNGVNNTHYTLFVGEDVTPSNVTFSEANYCATAESLSYTTPTVGGLKAAFTYAPDNESNQGTALAQARDFEAGGLKGDEAGQGISNIENRIDIAASWSTTMGAMNISVGAGYQQGGYQAFADNDFRSTTIAATVGFGALTFGASWFDNETAEAASEWDSCSAVQRAEDAIDLGNGAGSWVLPGTDNLVGSGDGTDVDAAQNKLGAAYWDMNAAAGALEAAQQALATEEAKSTPMGLPALRTAVSDAEANLSHAETLLEQVLTPSADSLATAPASRSGYNARYLLNGSSGGTMPLTRLTGDELAALRNASGLECYNGKSASANQDGYTLAAKYDMGNLTLGTTWSTMETDETGLEESALVLGASYSMGGGLTTWLEYMDLTVDPSEGEKATDDIILVGVTLGF